MPRRRNRVRFSAVALGIATTLVTVTTAIAQLPPGGTFTDDNGNVHEGFIEAIAADGVTKGCNPPANTLYCPDDDVIRGQMAAFLNRALNLPATGRDFFVDDDGSPYERDINELAASGITKGCNPPANTRFCPGDSVTRGQMAAFLVRAFGYSNDGGGDLFTDDDTSVFEADIDKLATARVTLGCNPPANNRFCPTDDVLRDQMASFLGRGLDLRPIIPPPPATTTTTTTTTTKPPSNCHSSYPDFCIPPPPPDLNCPDISRTDFRVRPPDPHRFDADKDGIGCET